MTIPIDTPSRALAEARESRIVRPPARPEAIPVLGVPVSAVDYDGTLDWMDGTVAARGRGYVCVAATHTVMVAQEDRETMDAVLGADLVVPDGQPLVWALRALGRRLPGRVYGPDLMLRHCERAARQGTRIFLYGGRNQGALVQLTLNLRRKFPGLRVVGGISPPFRDLDDAELDDVATEINRSGADVVWVGIGVPKQEKWMAAMRDRLHAPVLVGVGAAFDFHAGLVPQAPSWMQAAGLEWAFRLAQEPRRLWRRYLRYNPRFVTGFAVQVLGGRRSRAGG
jgi:N-acetylglucosaminyldiphosphoundecaprenol N-acetyl-beta-D-mannosaminyltransferase